MRKENKGKSRKSWLLGLLLGAGLWMLSPQTAEAADVRVTIVLVDEDADAVCSVKTFLTTEVDEEGHVIFEEATGKATCRTTESIAYTSNIDNNSVTRTILSCTTEGVTIAGGQITFSNLGLTNDDLILTDDGYSLQLGVKIQPLLRVHHWENEDSNTLGTEISSNDDGTFSVTLQSAPDPQQGQRFTGWRCQEQEDGELYDGGKTITIDPNGEIWADLQYFGEKMYGVHFIQTWVEAEVITEITKSGTYYLYSGSEYTLKYAASSVNNDGCTYENGIKFYVLSDDYYTFS